MSDSEWGECGYELSEYGQIRQRRLVRITEKQVRYVNDYGGESRGAIASDYYTWFPTLEAAEAARLARYEFKVECAKNNLERKQRDLSKAATEPRDRYYTPYKETT